MGAMKATVAALLTFAAAAPHACRTPTEMTERQLAKVTLGNLCDAYTQAERRLPDPVQAYEDVRDHYTTLWAPLIKMRAGVEGIDASVRYRLWLHFARHDYGVAGWSCPALDRLLLYGWYMVPNWHDTKFKVAIWNRFGRPDVPIREGFVLDSWWIDPALAAKTDAARSAGQ